MPTAWRAYWPLWFLGKYSQGKAHIDLGPHTVNCYFLKSGGKDVVVVPPEVCRAGRPAPAAGFVCAECSARLGKKKSRVLGSC